MKHHAQVINLLNTQIGNPAEVKDISDTAKKVANKWVDPVSGGKESINGLVYGLVQSGKTGVLSVSGAITVKLVNGETDEDVAVDSPYNLFVGGNKLGRGVTIKNLLVSYYGRNPKKPQADTVLQHARMYGYRRKDIGLPREDPVSCYARR